MITDAAVETATAVLEERGWERDEEMVGDVLGKGPQLGLTFAVFPRVTEFYPCAGSPTSSGPKPGT